MNNQQLMELLGFLKDSGVSPLIIGRIRSLVAAFEGTLGDFLDLSNGQIMAIYNRTHPVKDGKRPCGLGKDTFAALDTARRGLRVMKEESRTRKEQASTDHAALLEEARKEIGAEKVSLETMKETCEWLTLQYESCDLAMILDQYRRILAKKKGR